MHDFTELIRTTSHVPTIRAIIMANQKRLKKDPSNFKARRRIGACRYRLKFLRSHGMI